jgi:large subunit ribosomal protein L24
MKIRRGDKVQVIAGADRGKSGEVRQVWRKHCLLLLSGVNLYKKHLKSAGQRKGGVVERERPILIDKVMLLCPHCGKPTRASKKRICRHCSVELDGVK